MQEIGHADGGDHDRHTRRAAQRLIRDLLYDNTEKNGERNHKNDGYVPWNKQVRHADDHEVACHHENVAMGKIDQAENAINHGVANGNQRIDTANGQAIQAVL